MKDNTVSKIFMGRLNLNQASSWLDFEKGNKTQAIMHELKYRKNPEIGVFMGELMALEMSKSNLYSEVDKIIPVPLHKTKQKKRGYNQSYQVALGMAGILNIPIEEKALERKIKSESQTKKKRYERWENVNSVFEAKPEYFDNTKHVLLVDDVITTGATIEACANSIRSIKNIKISVITLARSD